VGPRPDRVFLSEDPIGLEGGINPYVYAGNDPLDFTGLYGLFRMPEGWVRLRSRLLPEPESGEEWGGAMHIGARQGPSGHRLRNHETWVMT
jgi:hypothetical protein